MVVIVAVVPAFNEEKRIVDVLKTLKQYVDRIIVVDDGSSDRTSEVSKKYALVVRHIINVGKGGALRSGAKKAIQLKAKRIVFIDSDGQHDPSEIKKFIEKLDKGYDLVQGVRSTKEMPFMKKIGNSMINSLFSMIFGLKVSDTQSGYKAFKTGIYPKIEWKSNDYFVETEILANAGKNGLRYAEVPIKTIYREKYKGITVMDGLKIGAKTIMMRLLG
jgi:glycosyltransferase involved in cell wall biosynthesis